MRHQTIPFLPSGISKLRRAFDDLHSETDTAACLCSDQCCATAKERIEYCLAGTAIVLYRPTHALDRLLCAMRCFSILLAAGYRPKRRLLAVARPMPFGAHGVPAWLVHPVVIAPSDNQALFGPDDLRANTEALATQTLRDRRSVQSAVPDVRHVARKMTPHHFSVGLRVIEDFALPFRLVQPGFVPPARIVVDTIGWVRDHELRRDPSEESSDANRVSTIAATDAMSLGAPDVAGAGYSLVLENAANR
jgi:hypothetical protein